ncbi:GNAT family N-acetyltransferase [Desulfosporosinus sp. FKA]|uniref:GNAT family N-acetyltransferase n=1 Tax=Desulfosporosinus sp. FKA TaxID=1969834 RepID=UPI000B49EC58|nr:GNAT family N-acetyltransferase [Desulfosporosinus sp. FKA]
MGDLYIRNYVPSDIAQVMELQNKYSRIYTEVPICTDDNLRHPAHPVYEEGKNIFCGFDSKDKMIAYASIFPRPVDDDVPSNLPHSLWIEVKVDPLQEKQYEIKDIMIKKVLERVDAICKSLPERSVRLCTGLLLCEIEAIKYFLSRGFIHTESLFQMTRDLTIRIPNQSIPKEVEIRKWKIETKEERQKYIKADNLSFLDSPTTIEALEYLLQSPQWATGTAISAFDISGEIVGSIMVYWDETQNNRGNEKCGFTEEIFVIPNWRGRGIAKYLIMEGLNYLAQHGLREARLEVMSKNRNALTLYESMGYIVNREEKVFGRNVKE